MARHFGLKSKPGPPRPKKDTDLKGRQELVREDVGGKQGGQADAPKSPPRPRSTGQDQDNDALPKRSKTNPDR